MNREMQSQLVLASFISTYELRGSLEHAILKVRPLCSGSISAISTDFRAVKTLAIPSNPSYDICRVCINLVSSTYSKNNLTELYSMSYIRLSNSSLEV